MSEELKATDGGVEGGGGGGGGGVKGDPKYELEDYVYDMECRASEQEADDVYARLEQKERDLILAAELGKALLERNEVLVSQNERLAEEYSHKLEVSSQRRPDQGRVQWQ